MILKTFSLAFFIFGAALSIEVEYKDCGSKQAAITKVEVDPCDNPKSCSLKKGTNPKISVTFSTKEAVNNVTAVVYGVIGGIPIPFALPHPDGCTESGLTCPIPQGAQATYFQQLEIKHEYPNLAVIVEWELKDQTGQYLVCFRVKTRITD